ncbi:hypothetical protein OA331_00020 [Bacteroidota bacterium]|nr:hypothetical protein [Bacteroidota bacterium]
MKSVSILVTDKYSNLHPNISGSLVFIWDEFSKNKNYISIPSLVEEKAEKYRLEFLDWVHFFHQTKINGMTLYNHLKLDDDFPFWWTTSLGQKFNIYDHSKINDVIKSMAFYDYLQENKIDTYLIEVRSEKKALVNFFRQNIKEKKLKIKFIQNLKNEKKNKSVFMYAVFIFRFVMLRIFRNKFKTPSKSSFVFFDIFTHLQKGNKFKSNYWTRLVDVLEKKSVIWNHIYFRSNSKNNFFRSLKRIKIFNRNNIKHKHNLLEQDFDLRDFLKTLKIFYRLKKNAEKIIPDLDNIFFCNKRGIDFTPWIKDDFINSIKGQEALKNCYYNLLIKKAVNNSPANAKAIYIQEFQPWEIALVYYWKKARRKKIIGVPHSTHRYWDLRYFFGKLFFSSFSKDIFPDQIAVNGNYSYERCIENGYPESLLKPVEALRYIHHPPKPKTQEKNNRKCLNILICCDYQIKTSRELLRIVDKVTHKKIKYDINIRMHPSFPLPAKLIKKYNFRLSDDELLPALQKADWVITSNLSAIAVDAFYQGCKIGQLSDGLYFNLSPLRGIIDDLLFTDSTELKKMLEKNEQPKKKFKYFFIDHNLNLWRKLLFDDKA